MLAALHPAAAAMETAMTDAAERYIAAFERGEPFRSPPLDLISAGRPDRQAVERLRRELETAPGAVREGVVDLLADLAIQTDPMVEQGAAAIRDEAIIAILAQEGCARADQGCLAAMDALRTSAPTPLLAPHAARFAALLDAAPNETALYLAAKAKAAEAAPALERLEADPALGGGEALAIARAALGDAGAERKLAMAVEQAETGEALAEALGPAGLAGSPALLRLIGATMRTALTIDRPGVNETSVRLNVMDALRYNFPQVPAFYRNNVHDDADYLEIERLVEEHLGVVFDASRPAFLKVRGYPIPLPPDAQ